MSVEGKQAPVTTRTFTQMKERREKITMLTAYDYTLARLVDQSGVDAILVGDSAANVMAGYSTTVPMTLDAMIYHAQCVTRAVEHAMVVVDMPFGTYQGAVEKGIEAAVRIMQESQAHAVKMEGGEPIIPLVRRLVEAGIPVMGHLGLTPQSINQFGTYGVRAKEQEEANRLLQDARQLQEAGIFALVLEKIPEGVARTVTDSLTIPTIGIGAGRGVDGQVLVLHDMLGLTENFHPKFLREYAQLGELAKKACSTYVHDVKEGTFPNDTEVYS